MVTLVIQRIASMCSQRAPLIATVLRISYVVSVPTNLLPPDVSTVGSCIIQVSVCVVEVTLCLGYVQ